MSLHDKQWRAVCTTSDLVKNSGVCVLVNEDSEQEQQVALFYTGADSVYALGNFDPIGQANVMYRGLIGSLKGEPVVASPLYKQHYSLVSGQCLEQPEVQLPTLEVRVNNQNVELFC